MSEDAKTKDDGELVMEWTDELASWAREVDERAESESSALPETAEAQKTQAEPRMTPLVPAPGNADNDASPVVKPRTGAMPPPPPSEALRQRASLPNEPYPRASLPNEPYPRASLPNEPYPRASLPNEPYPRASLPNEEVRRPSVETGALERRLQRPPTAAEVAALERTLQPTMPPPSALEGEYADIAPIPIEVLDAINTARPLSITQPPAFTTETVRPSASMFAVNSIPTPLVQPNAQGNDGEEPSYEEPVPSLIPEPDDEEPTAEVFPERDTAQHQAVLHELAERERLRPRSDQGHAPVALSEDDTTAIGPVPDDAHMRSTVISVAPEVIAEAELRAKTDRPPEHDELARASAQSERVERSRTVTDWPDPLNSEPPENEALEESPTAEPASEPRAASEFVQEDPPTGRFDSDFVRNARERRESGFAPSVSGEQDAFRNARAFAHTEPALEPVVLPEIAVTGLARSEPNQDEDAGDATLVDALSEPELAQVRSAAPPARESGARELAPSSGRPSAPHGLEVLADPESVEQALETIQAETPERSAVRSRIALLDALARRQGSGNADELLISAAELAEGLHDIPLAESYYERALADSPKRAPALAALARLAFRHGDMARYTLLLERMAELPLGRVERARVLTALSLARWQLQHDVPGALGAATEAQKLAPEQLASNLLLARIEASSHPEKIDATLVPLALRTQDLGLASLWLVTAARALEARGELEEARTLYSRAASDDPFAFDAQFSLSRMNHALGAHAEAARALLRTLESFDIGPVAEAVRRRAAHMLGIQDAHEEAVELLEHASDDVSLRTAAQVALASDDAALKLRAVEAWTLGTDGQERALALLTQAELLGESGDLERADSVLQQAALADPTLTLIRVRREALARSGGNNARLAEIASSEAAGRGALAAAAQLALAKHDEGEELRWLIEAAAQESGVTAHLLAIDASGELGRDGQQRDLLRDESDRGGAQQQVLALLALAELERARGEQTAQRELLWQATNLAPRDLTVSRAYTRSGASAEDSAEVYKRDGDASTGVRAAFAHLREGYVSQRGSSGRLDAFSAAYRAAPDYLPAGWAFHREARRQGDLGRLGELHSQEAERASAPESRAAHLVRAALIRAGEDTQAAAQQLTRALELAPDDPVLTELVLRLGDAADADVRARALDRMAARAGAPFRRPLVIASAGTLEDAGRLGDAAERYRTVLAELPNDPIAEAGLERVTVEAERGEALLESKRRAVQDASTERTRARALEELLLLEPNKEQALELAHELFALSPTHPLALRALERDAMTRGDQSALLALSQRFLESGRGPRDKAARLRFVQLLSALAPDDENARGDFDRRLIDSANDARHSLWLSRHVLGSAISLEQRELVVRALALAAEQAQDPVERASLVIQRGWLTLGSETPASLDDLRDAMSHYPDHPTGLELIAELRHAAGEHEAAAEQFEHAALRALGNERGAYLWARAAELWDKTIKNAARARKALQKAAARDLDQPYVQERLSDLLTEQGDVDGLIAYTMARIGQGGEPERQIELLRKLSALEEQRGDRGAARNSLREALVLDAESLPVYRDLARLGERAGNHPERVEALSAVVRLSRDPLELRDALLELGEVYEQHIRDASRAEAAYQRVLKLGPRNTVALERLARLYRGNGQAELATETLMQLARIATEPRQRRDVTLQLVSWKEEQGLVRDAEELLEALRRANPTDQLVLRALTGLLRRTNAHVALAMHLNRAVNDLRQALVTRFDDPELWLAIVAMLVERGRLDVASQCAATASAVGVHAPELEKEARTDAEREGIGAAALSELLDDLVFPEHAPPGLRIVFRHAADALNKTAPLDLRVLGAEKLDKKHPLRNVLAEQARWVAHREIEVYVSAELPYAFVPIQDSPVQLLVGRALVDALTPDEQRFLVARALKISRAQMSVACRLGPQQLELLLHGLVRSQVASHSPPFLELSALEDAARRVSKQLSRRAQSELVPTLLELTYAGIPRFDAANVYGVASAAGSRAGLLATGNVDAALSALIKLSGLELENAGPAARVAQVEEARELVTFAISDAYFEARARAGKEPR